MKCEKCGMDKEALRDELNEIIDIIKDDQDVLYRLFKAELRELTQNGYNV